MLFLVVPHSTRAQSSNKANIEKAIDNYITGWRTGDAGLLEQAFDLDAGVIIWVDKSEDSEKSKSMLLSDMIKRSKAHPGYGVGYKIQNLDIIESQLAVAKVKIPRSSSNSYYIDYLQLQKINEDWKIVLKSFVYFPEN